MASTRWVDVRAEMTEKAGGDQAVAEARQERLAEEAGTSWPSSGRPSNSPRSRSPTAWASPRAVSPRSSGD